MLWIGILANKTRNYFESSSNSTKEKMITKKDAGAALLALRNERGSAEDSVGQNDLDVCPLGLGQECPNRDTNSCLFHRKRGGDCPPATVKVPGNSA